MNIALVDTRELRKTNLLIQVWKETMGSRDNPMTMASLLGNIPPEIKNFVLGVRSAVPAAVLEFKIWYMISRHASKPTQIQVMKIGNTQVWWSV